MLKNISIKKRDKLLFSLQDYKYYRKATKFFNKILKIFITKVQVHEGEQEILYMCQELLHRWRNLADIHHRTLQELEDIKQNLGKELLYPISAETGKVCVENTSAPVLLEKLLEDYKKMKLDILIEKYKNDIK